MFVSIFRVAVILMVVFCGIGTAYDIILIIIDNRKARFHNSVTEGGASENTPLLGAKPSPAVISQDRGKYCQG